MDSTKLEFKSIAQARQAIESIGAGNSLIMAGRALHINILLRGVPGMEAKLIKAAYNEIGAEAAISHQAYYESEGAVTDMIIMGSIYQHREVRRILQNDSKLKSWIKEIEGIVENSLEARESLPV